MKNYIQPGDKLTFENYQGQVSSGALVLVGDIIGVAVKDCLKGDDLVLDTEGVFNVPKVQEEVIRTGQKLSYFNSRLTIDYKKGPVVATSIQSANAGALKVKAKLLQTILPKEL